MHDSLQGLQCTCAPAALHLPDHKKVVLGTKPILLSAFNSGGQRHVFAASDRPTIIYSNNKKLLYSNLNENEVRLSCHRQLIGIATQSCEARLLLPPTACC